MKNTLSVWAGITVMFVIVNVLLLWFVDSTSKTFTLLQKEIIDLRRQEKLIASAKNLTTTYQKEIALISAVFPEEKTIPQFIKVLENHVASYSSEYSVKFNATTPLKEQDRLFLPLTITMRVDLVALTEFLAGLETLPYMTHVISINTKSPDGILNKSEIIIMLKAYVKDPFSE